MSQDHLEMFFSRVRRRGGWNNNPNCLQFKWTLRAILLKNRIMPSKNANVSVEEPSSNELFKAKPSASVHHTNANMQKFAELLKEPSEFHDHILHYLAGYIIRHVSSDCKCTQCCVALHKNTSDSAFQSQSMLTTRKDRGGLIKPRDDVFQIVKTTDRLLRQDIASYLVVLINTLNKFIVNKSRQILSKQACMCFFLYKGQGHLSIFFSIKGTPMYE